MRAPFAISICRLTKVEQLRLTILLTSFALPILLTWLGYFPYMSGVLDRIKPWLYPSISLIGNYHDRPLPFALGNLPTVGQSFYIFLLFILNIVFLAVGYDTMYPNQAFRWYSNKYQELMAYVMWRTGVLAFCQMPILFLFSSRNNILLWLANWSHSTYMLLHRWVARFFLFQTLLHSIIAVVLYKNAGIYESSFELLWWKWGIVATVAAVVVVVTSFLIIRQRAYELFLITHIVMAIICLVGCWYHVWFGYENTFGYESWLYATIAVWFFDRLVRIARILKVGIRRAKVTSIGPTIARIDVPGIRWTEPGCYVFVYFPTLNPLRPWENHPFSVIQTTLLTRNTNSKHAGSDSSEIEKHQNVTLGSEHQEMTYIDSGLTLFVRKTKGITKYLQAHDGLLTLLEGPYRSNPAKAVLQSDRLLLIGGGIGITGLLSFTWRHPNVKLFHSVKTDDRCLVDCLSSVLNVVREKEICIGKRLDIVNLLRDECDAGFSKIGVVVCGPPAMCDDVRAIVAQLGKERSGKCSLELEVHAFSW